MLKQFTELKQTAFRFIQNITQKSDKDIKEKKNNQAHKYKWTESIPNRQAQVFRTSYLQKLTEEKLIISQQNYEVYLRTLTLFGLRLQEYQQAIKKRDWNGIEKQVGMKRQIVNAIKKSLKNKWRYVFRPRMLLLQQFTDFSNGDYKVGINNIVKKQWVKVGQPVDTILAHYSMESRVRYQKRSQS